MEIQGVGTDEGAGLDPRGRKLALDPKKRENDIRPAGAFVSGSIVHVTSHCTESGSRQRAEEAEEAAAAAATKTFYFYTFFFLRRACE